MRMFLEGVVRPEAVASHVGCASAVNQFNNTQRSGRTGQAYFTQDY